MLFETHADDARRMVRDGQATVRTPGKRIREIVLAHQTRYLPKSPATPMSPRSYAGRPTTRRERLVEPNAEGHMVVVGVVLQFRRVPRSAWPIYRAALVDCLPPDAQAEIREIFA